MKPRPVISLALPRAVGVESECEIADVRLRDSADIDALHRRLDEQLPDGLTLLSAEPAEGRPASSRLRAVAYRVDVFDDVDWDEAIARYQAAEEAVVTRTAPNKADKRVDVKQFCSGIEHRRGRLLIELE